MNWKRWIRPGLVLSLLVALVAIFAEDRALEGDLSARVGEALYAEGQGWASLEVDSRDVILRGQAPSTESQELAVRAAGRVAGVRRVVDGSELLPIVSPFIWTARVDGQALRLSGNIPSEGARGSVLAAARRAMPESEIRDEMQLARGAPQAFNAAVTFALDRLAQLSDGVVTLTDTTLSVRGTAATAAAYAGAGEGLIASLPAGVSPGPVDVLPPRAAPFVWSADYDGETVTMVGFVPNEIVHETLNATIRATLPGVTVVDNTAVASGEPAGFAEAAAFAIRALERLRRGGVTLDGLSLDVSGDAKSVDDHEALLASLAGPFPQGMTVVAAAVTPAPVSLYGWQAERAGETVTLAGFVPNPAVRDDVEAGARILFAGLTIENHMRVASGEPRMDWLGAINFAMGELSRLRSGRVAVGDRVYSIEGEALTSEAYTAVAETNALTLPASLELESAKVVPPAAPEYRFVAERRGGTVVIEGHVPDEGSRQTILTEAQRKFGSAEIRATLVYASGAPDGFTSAAEAALQALSRVSGGKIAINGNQVSLEGAVYQPAAVHGIDEGLAAGLPDGFAVSSRALIARQGGQPVAPEKCGELLQAVLKTGRIEFEDGDEAQITLDSYGMLDRVAGSIARCPGVRIEIGAYTDSEGSQSRNRDRTQARADAIVDYLANAGIRRERLDAVGHGEDDPIADNDTEAGRAANRRIVFAVELPNGG